MVLLALLDPEGTLRKHAKLKRRIYRSKVCNVAKFIISYFFKINMQGPNFLWHVMDMIN